MERIDEIRSPFDILCNTNLTSEDDIPEISSEEKANLIKLVNNAKADAQRLRIVDIMNKVGK